MYNKVYFEEITQNQKYLHGFIIVFGSICGMISFIMSFIEIVKAFSEPTEEILADV